MAGDKAILDIWYAVDCFLVSLCQGNPAQVATVPLAAVRHGWQGFLPVAMGKAARGYSRRFCGHSGDCWPAVIPDLVLWLGGGRYGTFYNGCCFVKNEKDKEMGMNKYTIDYGYNVATLYTESPKEKVIFEFYKCANACFGIRKSITEEPKITMVSVSELPKKYQGKGVTHLLIHNPPIADYIAFDANFVEDGFRYWKVIDEWGDECVCERGTYSPYCEVHKHYLEGEK